MARKYELKRRAEAQEATRQRIVDAAIDLHATVGPARTTIKAVAERAGVQRHTVYRHFPTEEELIGACSAAWDARHPFPDPAPWAAIADPEARLRRALHDVFAYYAAVEDDLRAFLRDAEAVPAIGRAFEAEARERERLRDMLATGWGVRGARRRRLLAAVGHALDFEAWRSLARGQGAGADDAVELMAGMVCAAAGRAPARAGGRARAAAA